jgi:pimeloyl-ACP methyl ester carboxylesterase
MRRLRNIVLVVGGLLILLAIVGACYQELASRADARRFPEPGRLVDVGGFRLKLNCTGAGSPTVVLESGLGDVSVEWQAVQSGVAKFTRVCSYDRAGYGGSDAGPMPRTSQQIAGELHALLKNAGEKPPFILVGHSFGGYNVRVFNGRFPDEVAGMVLVDTVQEDQYKLLPPVWNRVGSDLRAHYRSQARWAPVRVNLGIERARLQARGKAENSYLYLQSKYLAARSDEIEHVQISAEQARAAGTLGDKPLVVLTAGKKPAAGTLGLTEQDWDEYQRVWADELQLRLARLSSRGKREVVEGSGHNIPSERPDAIVNAVREIQMQISSRLDFR